MIDTRYLLALNVPCYRDHAGVHSFDPLWARDLAAHMVYLSHLTLASPCAPASSAPGPLRPLSGRQPLYCDLPAPASLGAALRRLPSTVSRLWTAVGQASIVHTAIAGWPIPLGWLVVPIARLRSRRIVIVVESAPWRLPPGLPANWKQRARAGLSEHLARWCLRHADLTVVTHEGYREMAPSAHVVPASWIGASDLLSDDQAVRAWDAKPAAPLHLVFAGRLEAQKGVRAVLDALPLLAQQNTPLRLQFIGDGPLRQAVVESARQHPGLVQWSPPIPYDSGFLSFLGRHHAVLVPSLSDEQPRIVYDAYSQALPVLAGATSGLRDVVVDGATGLVAPSGDPRDWFRLLQSLDAGRLRRMGLHALALARSRTHEQMHLRREELLRALTAL